MPLSLKQPEPGDLITAQDMSTLIALVLDLKQRIAALEQLVPGAGGALAILDLQWCGPVPRVGDEMRIVGLNLGLEGEGEVRFGAERTVTSYEDISHERLILVKVPTLAITPDSGKQYEVSVVRKDGRADSRHVQIFPRAIAVPEGQIKLEPAPLEARTVRPGPLTLAFPLRVTSLNLDTEFDVLASAILDGVTREELTVQTLDEDGKTITKLALPKTEDPGFETTIQVRVTVPNRSAFEILRVQQAKLVVRLSLSSTQNPALNQNPEPVTVVVTFLGRDENEEIPSGESRFPIVFRRVEPGEFKDGAFQLPQGPSRFAVLGTVDLSEMPEAPVEVTLKATGGWSADPPRFTLTGGRSASFEFRLLRLETSRVTPALAVIIEGTKNKEVGGASFPIVSSLRK